VCLCLCVYVCVCVCVCVWCTHTHVYTHIHMQILKSCTANFQTKVLEKTCTYTRIPTHIYIHTCTHTNTHTYTHTDPKVMQRRLPDGQCARERTSPTRHQSLLRLAYHPPSACMRERVYSLVCRVLGLGTPCFFSTTNQRLLRLTDYGVATTSRLLKSIGLFCKRAL